MSSFVVSLKKSLSFFPRLLHLLTFSFAGINRLHPARHVLLGYLFYAITGWVLLCLPWSQKAVGVSSLDNLFVTVSAISTTGLSTISISDSYTLAGQIIILMLIQLGGIGYMTIGSFIILSTRTTLSDVRREVSKTVFSLPDSFQIDKFILSVIRFTLIIETIGALGLYYLFQREGVDSALWTSIFHSVSSFCTAGFSLYNNSMEGFCGHFWINALIAALSYLGAIGFIVAVDLWRMLKGKTSRITMTSKIILWMTFWMSVLGTLLLFISVPTIQDKPVDKRLLAAFFQSMTAMTTVGFNSIPIGSLSNASALLLTIWMIIGASPSGTGGGIKSTTFSALLGVMKSVLDGRKDVRFWGKTIPQERIWMAIASIGFYLTFLLVGCYLLELTESSSFVSNIFEAASALGTVGLSMGITAGLTVMGKLIIILLMFVGRLGPLTLGIALFLHRAPAPQSDQEDLAV